MKLAALILIALLGSAIPCAWTSEPSPPLSTSPVPGPARWGVERKLPSPKLLKPGIYETAPYTCIVIVPQPHVDDGIIVRPREPVPSIPIITVRPELRFIPWSAKK